MVRGLLRSKPTKMAQALMSTKPQEDGEKSSGKNEHLLFFTNFLKSNSSQSKVYFLNSSRSSSIIS